MTPIETLLVRQGFDHLAPRAEAVGFAIYGRIFELDPSARTLFREDMRPQVRHFMGAVSMVVQSLDNLEPIPESIQSLGRRHASYGVEPRHFELAGIALLATLEAELGDAFTLEGGVAACSRTPGRSDGRGDAVDGFVGTPKPATCGPVHSNHRRLGLNNDQSAALAITQEGGHQHAISSCDDCYRCSLAEHRRRTRCGPADLRSPGLSSHAAPTRRGEFSVGSRVLAGGHADTGWNASISRSDLDHDAAIEAGARQSRERIEGGRGVF